MPKAKVLDGSAKVPGTDGEKMSKSYNNTIELFEPAKAMRKKIMRITTDSRPMEEPKENYADDHLYQLYSLFASDEQKQEMAALYLRGGFGYGQVKTALADIADAYFADARARREAARRRSRQSRRDSGRWRRSRSQEGQRSPAPCSTGVRN